MKQILIVCCCVLGLCLSSVPAVFALPQDEAPSSTLRLLCGVPPEFDATRPIAEPRQKRAVPLVQSPSPQTSPSMTTVPEPSTIALVGVGLFLVGVVRYRTRSL